MKTIIIKSQKELDELPNSFDEFTVIEIRSEDIIKVSKQYDSSIVKAFGSSVVKAYGSSRLVAHDSSTVVAHDSSTVVANDSSRVVANDSSRVMAHDSSRVVANDSSRVTAHSSSRVEAHYSSRVEARDYSRVEAYMCSTVTCYSKYVTIEKLLDNARLIYKTPDCKRPMQVDSIAIVTAHEDIVEPTFNQWIERGYVMADGILKKHKKTKQLDNGLTLYEVFNDISEKETSFVVTDGAHYSHGKTLRQAVSDLMFKKSKRDASKYKNIKPDQLMKIEDAIVMYRTITGACSQGVEEFIERNLKDRELVTVIEIIKITEGQYGHEQFKNFGWMK